MTGGVDTHVHIIGNPQDYPMVQDRRYTPGVASTGQLLAHLQQQQLTHAVIVQPSVYGFDNRCMLDALTTLNQQASDQARGVAVLPESITDEALQQLDKQGVRGIRLNIESAGHFTADDLAQQLQFWGMRLVKLDWHIQVYAPMAWLANCEAVIVALPVPVVLDHFGLWTDATCESNESAALLRLLAAGHTYIKLSASYRVPIQGTDELQNLVKRLLNTRADRLLWGSDWPHTSREAGRGALEVSRYRDIDPAVMLQERIQWLTAKNSTGWQQQVLIDNPVRLYRF